MSLSAVEQQAKDWIEMTCTPEVECSDELFEAGFALNVLAHDDPELAWAVILNVVEKLDKNELASGDGFSRKLASNLAAGPIESLLASHGLEFIDLFEQKANDEVKFRWILDGIWQNEMSNKVWKRVCKLAGRI